MMRFYKKTPLFLFFLIVVCVTSFGQTTFIGFDSTWEYFDNETEPAVQGAFDWNDNGYIPDMGIGATQWQTGQAELGYGDGDEKTVVNTLTEVLYLRQSFNVPDPSIYDFLKINLIFDDGAVVYLNGTEVWRENMPTGIVSYSTFTSSLLGDDEFASIAISNSLLTGNNVIAVEVHQVSAGSSDLSFNLEMTETETRFIGFDSSWDYFDNASEPANDTSGGDNWKDLDYNTIEATGWSNGQAELGYGDGDEKTTVNPLTQVLYVRQSFNVLDPTIYDFLNFNLIFDDGAVVYLNGIEVWRVNMPVGPVSYSTYAPDPSNDNESANIIIANSLLTGPNVIAIEVHQTDNPPSSDISFNFELAETDLVTRDPYLQQGTPSSIVVKWRTALVAMSNLEYDTDINFGTPSPASNPGTGTEHEVLISGLLPDTKYYYRLKNDATIILEDTANDELFFTTHPVVGTSQPYRFWVLGDAGSGGDYDNDIYGRDAENVRDVYYSYLGNNETNGILFLGDNAYFDGTDAEYQRAFFDIFDDKLKNTIAWSCLGNHDGFSANSGSQTGPYYDIFTFPKAGESGGISSGTEAYYSFDYGNVHFIVLDSYETDRTVGGSMYDWAESDIQNTTQQWIVAFWHHPPYSKGSHDSDNLLTPGDNNTSSNTSGSDVELIQMRENFLPMLEANGVDLVLGGHSHSYERSYLINGHYGLANTFNLSNNTVGATGDGDGEVGSGGAYSKSLIGADAGKGAVYVVTGSAGQKTGGDLNHQAMYVSLNELGSSVIEVDGNNLTLKFLGESGAVEDEFTITKGDYEYVHVLEEDGITSKWFPSVPPDSGPHNVVVRAGNPTIASSTNWNSLTVNPGAGLTIGSLGALTTSNGIDLNSASRKYSSLVSEGSITGSVSYNRWVNESGATNTSNNGNDLISAPVAGQTFGSFATANITNLAASGAIRAFAPFDNTITTPTAGVYVNYIVGTDDAETFDPGIGYRAATTYGSTLTFTGAVNTGTVSRPIAIGVGSAWNLIGNPYPSYLKVNDVTNGFLNNVTNTGLMDVTKVAIYGYDGDASDGWNIYNLANTTASTVIAPGQGFFVAASGTGNIEFTSNMRSVGSDDDFIVGRTINTTKVLSKLQASIGTEIYKTDIYFIDGRTRGLDPGYDAGAFQGNAAGIFTNLVEENTGVEMVIQALPYEDFNNVVVPLGIKANSGTQLTIAIEETSTLSSNINVYIEDNVANTFTLLNSTDYTFIPSEDLNGTGRFFIHYTSSTLSLENEVINGLQIFATSSPRNIVVNGKLLDTTVIDLYDLQGRLVLSMNLDTNSISNKINVDFLSTGIYIVKLKIGGSTKTQKVIIR